MCMPPCLILATERNIAKFSATDFATDDRFYKVILRFMID